MGASLRQTEETLDQIRIYPCYVQSVMKNGRQEKARGQRQARIHGRQVGPQCTNGWRGGRRGGRRPQWMFLHCPTPFLPRPLQAGSHGLSGTSTLFPSVCILSRCWQNQASWSLVSDPFPHWVLSWLSFPSTSVPLGLYSPFLPLWTWWCGAQHPACGWALSPSILYLPGLMTSDTVFRLRNLPCIRLI